MGTVTISFEMTLDGVFDQMEHWFDENDPELLRHSDELVFGADAVLLGRKSFEFFREYWPAQTDDRGFAAHYNALPKFVASRTLREPDVTWPNTTLLTGDTVLPEVRRMKTEPGGDIVVLGSAALAGQLIAEGLVDEYRLMIEPILLGGGKRLFPEDTWSRRLELVSVTTAATGVLMCTYRPA